MDPEDEEGEDEVPELQQFLWDQRCEAAHGESSQPEWTMRRHCIVYKIFLVSYIIIINFGEGGGGGGGGSEGEHNLGCGKQGQVQEF